MAETKNSSFDTDVLIVGAGPIGLATACALRHHGLDCRILEQRREIRQASKANNIWARPQELLHAIGVRSALIEKAYRIKQVNAVLNGRPIEPEKIARVDSPFPELLFSGQDVIETTLSDLVGHRGSPVERGRRLTGLEQDDEGVTITVAPAPESDSDQAVEDAPNERLRCRYLIGADGVQSTVRHLVGLDFETQRFEHRANRQIDARLSWRRPTDPDQVWFFYYKDGFAGVLPVWGGYHRLYFLESDAGVPERDPSLEEIEELARRVTGDDTLTLSDPIWSSFSRFKHGVAEHYARDRVLLVGDAGHHTLPIGGQGMNAGFHDAVCIAWRLAMTLAGAASPELLASYDDERQGEHARLDEQQADGFRKTAYRGALTDAVLDVGARLIPDLGARIQGTADLQQLSVSYPKSPLNSDHLRSWHLIGPNAPKAGERAPDAEVTDAHGATTSLFAHIYNPDGQTWGWSLLAFDGRQDDARPDLLAAADAVVPWSWVRPRLVLAGPLVDGAEERSVKILSDQPGQAHLAYGLDGTPAIVLIRPDGHIAFRGPLKRLDLLETYCTAMFSSGRREFGSTGP